MPEKKSIERKLKMKNKKKLIERENRKLGKSAKKLKKIKRLKTSRKIKKKKL
jgi:hypothetical protein